MYSVLPSHFFGDAKRLSWLQRRARERPDPSVPVLATATFEQWAPSWVEEGLPAQAKALYFEIAFAKRQQEASPGF